MIMKKLAAQWFSACKTKLALAMPRLQVVDLLKFNL